MEPTIHRGTKEIDWAPFVERYRRGEWRAPIFADIILTEMRRLGPPHTLTLLDIGCGKGFDDDRRLQAKIAVEAGQYLGVEPDERIAPNPLFHHFYSCRFEEAPLGPGSVDLAFAVMVLEHLEFPDRFWSHLHRILREGGAFWGFTMDARHWFAKASSLTKKLGIKEWYLNWLHGRKGEERYENYPVYYRSNTPEQIQRWTPAFRSRTFLNFNRIGQLDYYFPASLRWIGRGMDRYWLDRGLPGPILAVRVEK
jgi:SAM-dependent methyltransferase